MTQNIFRAFDFAKARGTPFNKYVVIRLHETDAMSAATIFARILDKCRVFFAYKARKIENKLPPLHVFTFETEGGQHVNWVLRVPPHYEKEFMQKLPRWIEKVQGPLGPYDLHVETVTPQDAYKQLANYIAKGCDPAALEHFHLKELHDHHGPQGAFYGKRAGISAALNKTARDDVGYNNKKRCLREPSAESGPESQKSGKAA